MGQRLVYFFLIVMCLVSNRGASQSPGVKNFTTESGLPSNETYYSFQDSKGFIWIATDNGVVRFDGLSFETYKIREGLEDPVVFGITEDKKGNIWFRSYSGKLFFYNDGKVNAWRLNDRLAPFVKNALVTQFIIDTSNTVWLSTNQGKLLSIDTVGNLAVVDSTIIDESVIKEVDNFLFTLNANLLPGVVRIENKNHPVSILEIPSSNNRTVVKWHDKIYASYNASLFEFDAEGGREVLRAPYGIISAMIDNDDQLWIGYLNGATRYKDNTFKGKWNPPIPKDASVTHVHHDREGGFWITTLERGVFYIPQIKITNHQIESKIRSLTTTTKGLLLNTYSEHLIEIDTLGKFSSVTVQLPLPYNTIFQDHNGNYWIENSGLSVVDKNFKLLKHYISDGANAVSIFEKDQRVYALNYNRLFTFNNYNVEKISQNRRDIYRSIVKVDSLFFIAGRLGLSIFNDNLVERRKLSLFNNIKVASQKQINDSIIVVGTLGYGFYLYNKNSDSATQFNSDQNFLADNVYSVLRDDTILWMGTEKGVARVSIASLLANKPTVNWLTVSSGLASNKINHVVKVKSSLWAFFDQGASCIPLNEFTSAAESQVRFYIKDLLFNGSPKSEVSNYDLAYNENNIKIRFGFVSLQNQDMRIRYKLKENEPWQYTTERLFEFSSLSPDDYQLYLQYSTDNFNWVSVDVKRLPQFVIHPPWWRTFVFQSILFVVIWILVFIFFRNRIRYYQQRNKLMTIANEHQQQLINAEISALERERGRIAKELHDSVGTDLSALKLILSQVLKDKTSKQIEEQLQGIIQEIKGIIYGLTPPGLERYGLSTIVKNYIEKLDVIGIKIQFDFYGTEIKDFNTSIIIFRIIQELISNSLKHSGAQNIRLSVNAFSDLISIVYEDDGKGFKYDAVNPGLGLQNIESRIKLMHGQTTFESGEFGICYTFDIPVNQPVS